MKSEFRFRTINHFISFISGRDIFYENAVIESSYICSHHTRIAMVKPSRKDVHNNIVVIDNTSYLFSYVTYYGSKEFDPARFLYLHLEPI